MRILPPFSSSCSQTRLVVCPFSLPLPLTNSTPSPHSFLFFSTINLYLKAKAILRKLTLLLSLSLFFFFFDDLLLGINVRFNCFLMIDVFDCSVWLARKKERRNATWTYTMRVFCLFFFIFSASKRSFMLHLYFCENVVLYRNLSEKF